MGKFLRKNRRVLGKNKKFMRKNSWMRSLNYLVKPGDWVHEIKAGSQKIDNQIKGNGKWKKDKNLRITQ